MSIDALNGSNQIFGKTRDSAAASETKRDETEEASIYTAKEAKERTKNLKKQGIEAETQDEDSGKISRKEAKAWIEEYKNEHPEASTEDAKTAFESEFGYKVPDSGFIEALSASLIGTPFGLPGFIGGKERSVDYVETKKNRDVE